jgi:hypothetical protein
MAAAKVAADVGVAAANNAGQGSRLEPNDHGGVLASLWIRHPLTPENQARKKPMR